MHQALARPEQTQSPIEIITHALREAVLAPTDTDALDIAGDALKRLADLVERRDT
ncbi:hypothetical protein [Paraburkholderia caribensis]|uniref:hypothetical protein n=1 Tax=Paraburkholderia caribensis TaxID=75105 RepID=UPI001CC6CDAC|nr:hypothetical protein [Paraburkholderia caribensis]